MDTSSRISAAIAYIPVIGWLYVALARRGNTLAMFHLRQSIGLIVFLLASLAAWFVVSFILAWIPLAFIFAAALFTMVICAFVVGIFAWVTGIINALRGRASLLPLFGALANRF